MPASLALLIGAGLGLLVGGAIGAAAGMWLVTALREWMTDTVAGMVGDMRHTRSTPLDARTARDLDEAELIEFVAMREKLDESIARRQHIFNGGHVDDSPTKWDQKDKRK